MKLPASEMKLPASEMKLPASEMKLDSISLEQYQILGTGHHTEHSIFLIA